MLPNRLLLRKAAQLFIDLCIFVLSYFAAFLIRFEDVPKGIYSKQFSVVFVYVVLLRLIVFYFSSVYSIVYRYISITDVLLIAEACLPVSVILFLSRLFLPDNLALFRLPLGVIALEFLLVLTGTLGVRMGRRLFSELSDREKLRNNQGHIRDRRVLLIGAGDAGNMIARELKQRTDLGLYVLGFVDDDPNKLHTMIQGISVLGHTSEIPKIVEELEIDEAIITIANASSKDIRRLVALCKEADAGVRIIPALYEILNDKIRVTKIREVNIDDLLGRSVVSFRNHRLEIISQYRDKKILVTGAGGTIGSELCRQLSNLAPRELIILDKDEYGVYEATFELSSRHSEFKTTPVIADARDRKRLRYVFDKYRPDVVFHAAAHKHVPLMERNIPEAILNNVVGTMNISRFAHEFHAEKFIFISTDKAVNPISVMGASKKIGEIIIQQIASRSTTRYSCVRFGNVLGSRGSVVPLFQKQIARGGPITITHPEVRRYFMSISEAVQLIIQAGTIGDRGEVFVLDMGEPVKIQELAEHLLKLSGLANDDIEIQYIGLRPGEKLHEELLINEEKAKATQFEKIFMAPPLEMDTQKFTKELAELIAAAQVCDENKILKCLSGMGIAYHSRK